MSPKPPYGRKSRLGQAPTFEQSDVCQIRGNARRGGFAFSETGPGSRYINGFPEDLHLVQKAPEGEGLYKNLQLARKEDEDLCKNTITAGKEDEDLYKNTTPARKQEENLYKNLNAGTAGD